MHVPETIEQVVGNPEGAPLKVIVPDGGTLGPAGICATKSVMHRVLPPVSAILNDSLGLAEAGFR